MGKIKEGKGSLISNAGEYLVVGELLKRGIIAALAPRANPSFDVLATNGRKSLNIRVKAKTPAANSWVWVCKKDKQRTIFKNLNKKLDFTILVDLKGVQEAADYYIVPTIQLDRELRDIFDRWLRSPGKRGKPHNPNNRMYRIGLGDWLSQWKGTWSLILSELEHT